MSVIVGVADVLRPLAAGAQIVEVLPNGEYHELHIPAAINIPLTQLNAETTRHLDRGRDVVVYCFDGLRDLSPRAACRLATLGFTRVHDYAAGKVDWLAHGMPADGMHAKHAAAGSLARRDAATCELGTSARDAIRAIGESAYGYALVLSATGVLLGRVRRSALEAIAADAPIEQVPEPGPSTIRPHLTADELRDGLRNRDVRTLLVTRPDGILIGVLRRDDVPQRSANNGAASACDGARDAA